jgi:8-oxo-dGTP diphosphatase
MCSHAITEKKVDGRVREACSSCGYINYMNPAPAVGVFIVENGSILLVRRKFEPKHGMWSIPAGFVEADENVEECAVRELKEETNLDIEVERIFNVYSGFDDPRTAAVLIIYLGKRTGGELECGDDASEARFFKLDDLPGDIAFKAHRDALAELRDYIES